MACDCGSPKLSCVGNGARVRFPPVLFYFRKKQMVKKAVKKVAKKVAKLKVKKKAETFTVSLFTERGAISHKKIYESAGYKFVKSEITPNKVFLTFEVKE